jgi:hypothetical protein
MTTAAATITPPLTPSQQAAREFWRQAGANGMPPFYVMSQYYAELSANSGDLPTVTAALEQLLTGLGYETDVDTLFSELAAGQGEELGYWAGRYCLFDSAGNRFDLVVGRNGATLTVPPALVDVTSLPAGTDLASVTVLSDAKFSDGVLQLENAQFQASLRFTLPVSDATLDVGAAAFQATAPTCQGTFGPKGGGAAGSRAVNGKRGAWTQAGVNQTADGDPASAWYGQYVLLDVTDVTAVKQDPNPVYIYNDPQSGLTFQWGDGNNAKYSGTVIYNNNVLQSPDEDDPTTNYAMQFIAPQVGAAEINLAVTTAGVVGSYKGYWVGRYPPPSPVPQARLAKRSMTAVYTPGSGASAGGYSQAIDVSKLAAGDTNKIALPYGAVGNKYALSLNLTNCTATDKFSWTVSNDPTGRASLAPSGGANQTVQFSLDNLSDSDVGPHLQVTVQLTNNSAAPPATYTLLFDIAVIKCDTITLAPTVLPPVVVGTPYAQKLTAYGARGKFTWSDPNPNKDPTKGPSTSLPPGLTWDDSSQQLSGTVTDAAQVGNAFSLAVGLAAPDVVMDALTTSLSITVQSGPAVASSSMPSWELSLIILGSSMATAALAAFALNRLLQGKADPKTVETIETGWTNIGNTTGGNPKSVGQSILHAENAMLPEVEDNIPNIQSTIDQINEEEQKTKELVDGLDNFIDKLEEYIDQHRGDAPDARVEDADLYGEGYHTYQDVETGYRDLVLMNREYRESLYDLRFSSNAMEINIASSHNRIDESGFAKHNNENFLDK